MRTKKIILVHFSPIERYPPAVNLTRFLADTLVKKTGFEIELVTTKSPDRSWVGETPGILIRRYEVFASANRMIRLVGYFLFNLRCLITLILKRPQIVMYFETLSSWAPVFYKQHINNKVELFIHYHEYSSAKEYEEGMIMNRKYHQKELGIYPKATWVSHTNQQRLNLFLADLKLDHLPGQQIMPNYPPLQWKKSKIKTRRSTERIRFVYIGALSFDTTYVKEFAEFISRHTSAFTWDIYTDNYADNISDFFTKLNAENINFYRGVSYDQLPELLAGFDIGLILYRGTTLNFTFNAPNKYFEYRICGLNIAFPFEMKGLIPFEMPTANPWVRKLDFNHLNIQSFIDGRRTDSEFEYDDFAETEYKKLAAAFGIAI